MALMPATAVERMFTKANFGRPFSVANRLSRYSVDEDPIRVSGWVSIKVKVADILYDLEALVLRQVIGYA